MHTHIHHLKLQEAKYPREMLACKDKVCIRQVVQGMQKHMLYEKEWLKELACIVIIFFPEIQQNKIKAIKYLTWGGKK